MNAPQTLRRRVRRPLVRALQTAIALGATPLALDGLAQPGGGAYSLILEEVLVTAQKREENFMAVPAAVNAFTAQDMVNTGAVSIQDIDTFIPGVDIGDVVGGSTQSGITIRGLSVIGISSGQDPTVAVFYDGAYMPRATFTIPFTDIAQTEVLKGPQGTLFGRNATGGVINIIPNKPSDELEANVKARFGSKDQMRFEGMGNVPVGDTLALRGNIFYEERDGFVESVTTGGDYRDESFWAARAVALFTPTENTDIQFAFDYEDRDEMPRLAVGVSPYAFMGSDDPFRGRDQHDVSGPNVAYDSNKNREEETREMYGVSLKLDHAITDELSVFAITSYREWDTTNLQEEDGTANPRRYLDTNNIEESDIFYNEIRFNFVSDGLDLIVGANYSDEGVFQRTDIGVLADSYMQFVTVLGGFGGQDEHVWDSDFWNEEFARNLTDALGFALLPQSFEGTYFTETMDNTGDFVNWGVFADATYQITDTIRLAAGLRYSYDEKEYSWQTYMVDVGWGAEPERVNYQPTDTGATGDDRFNKFVAKDDWNQTTGRLVADWQFSETAMAYASYATGYKSGGFDGQTFQGFVTGAFDPEEIESFELGLKGDFCDDSLRVEFAVFNHKLDDRQIQVNKRDSADDPTSAPGIIGQQEETIGAELILTWSIIDSLRVSGLTTIRESESTPDQYFNSAGDLVGGVEEKSQTGTNYTLK
ncbi:MAG: TonB-dependent receptor, partial [Halioglobus sp.]|nr:TonB-dependent receptor [Halioglobus sp.]